MPVFSDSRYRSGRVVTIDTTRNGASREMPFIYTRNPVSPDVPIRKVHRVVAGERLDQLAKRYAGESSLWWVLADVNNIFSFPLFLVAGTQLRIPTRDVFKQVAGV